MVAQAALTRDTSGRRHQMTASGRASGQRLRGLQTRAFQEAALIPSKKYIAVFAGRSHLL